MSLEILIPDFFGTKKFREKKLGSAEFFSFFKNNNKIVSTSLYNNVS